MAIEIHVNEGGFTFSVVCGMFTTGAGIVIDDTDDISHPAWFDAIKIVKSKLNYYHAVACLENDGHYMYQAKADPNDPYLIAVIEAYEKGIVPVKRETYQSALDIISGKAFLKTYRPKSFVPGYAYLMLDSQGLYKIGHSGNPAERLKKVTSKTNPVTLICQIASDKANLLEYELHELFHDFRVKGEWFQLAPDDVEYIKNLAVQA